MQGAKSASGIWSNLKFIVSFKFWAVLIVFAAGVLVGAALCGSGVALAHPGGLAKDGCHRDKAAGERHWHKPESRPVGLRRRAPCG